MIVCLLMLPAAFAQNKIVIHAVRDVSSTPRAILHEKPTIKASHYRLVEINIKQLHLGLMKAKHITHSQSNSNLWLELPLPDGKMASYAVFENTTMSPGLAAKFPNIKAYDGYGKSGELVKFDLTPKGFHAMIMKPGEPIVFIDPYSRKIIATTWCIARKILLRTKKCIVVLRRSQCKLQFRRQGFQRPIPIAR